MVNKRLNFFWALFYSLIVFGSCRESEAHVQGSSFYYYPKPNTYYDIEKKEYYIFSVTENKWVRKKELTEQERSLLGPKVSIDTPSVPVYKSNAHHRLIYSAGLYSNERDIEKKYIEDSLKSLPQKTSLPPDEKDKDKEKEKDEKDHGIKKFFKKIFGKDEEKEKKEKDISD